MGGIVSQSVRCISKTAGLIAMKLSTDINSPKRKNPTVYGDPGFSSNATMRFAFVYICEISYIYIYITIRYIVMKCGADTYIPHRMNIKNFVVTLTFPLAPSSRQNLNLSCKFNDFFTSLICTLCSVVITKS